MPLRFSRCTLLPLLAICAFFLGALPLTAAVEAAPPDSIAYTVTVADTSHHRFRVTATAAPTSDSTVTFALPAWSPGWYVLTHAYKNIGTVSATDETGATLTVTHPDNWTWRVRLGSGRGTHTVTLNYDLNAVDQDPDALEIRQPEAHSYGFFAPYLDDSHGFVPGPAALMYVEGAKAVPCRVTYKVPNGWAIASANDPAPGDPATFTAPDYDTLADQPADLGKFARWDRTLEGVPVSVVIVGGEGIDPQRWVDRTFQVAEAGIRFWGKAPFPRYVFHYRFPNGILGGGGLEHKNGTVIILSPNDLRNADADAMELVAHEYFHAWNVKRIRPAALGPFDYAHPVRVPDLWWLEGVTDYIAPLITIRAGAAPPSYWRTFIAAQISDLQNNVARRTVTLETASFKAWEGKSEGFGGLSYYNKGLVVGLLLDIEMRRRSENRVGLIDLLHTLFDETAASGKGYSDGEIERLTSRLTGGTDFKPFFDHALRSTDELPYADILPAAGLRLVDEAAHPEVGLHFAAAPASAGGLQIESVEPKSPADAAGLRAGDRVVSLNGRVVRSVALLPDPPRKVGDTLTITTRRGDQTRTVTLTAVLFVADNEHDYRLEPVPSPTALQSAIYAAISGAEAKSETPTKSAP